MAEILSELDRLFPRGVGRPPALLDVGCGDGYVAGELARRRSVDAHGIDISRPAVELAAKRYPGSEWVVGNADRLLPWADRSFDLVMSIASRRNGPEIRRVLADGGWALFVLPSEDDFAELRKLVLGAATRRDRVPGLTETLAGTLELVSRRSVRRSARLPPDLLRDVLATTYRGARTDQRERAENLTETEVTMSREILVFRAIPTGDVALRAGM
jgi:23S rRNA (guanine745-N1)-methyltransferase